ncbi:MAG: SNF2-related protein [Candidatus Firestonebacteria bacterium]
MSNIFIQRYLAEKLSLKKMAGDINRLTSSLAKSSIQLNPYQIYAAMYAFDSPLQRGAILADEVGLGKTIEAGIVISQLWAEGKRRLLIITPASLRKQWQDELSLRFGLDSEVVDNKLFDDKVASGEKVPLTYDGIFIVSYHFAYAKRGLIEKQKWNCFVIDEAHRLRNVYKGKDSSKMAWEIRNVVKNSGKLLLTATPLQNNLMELYGIASFIDDKLLGTPYSFKKRFVEVLSKNSELSKAKLNELRLIIKGEEKYGADKVSGILTRTLRNQVSDFVKFTERKAFTQDFTPTDEELSLYEKVSEYLQRPQVAAIQSTQRNLMVLVYRKLLASSSFAIASTLNHLVYFLEDELELRKQVKANVKKEPEIFAETNLEDEGLEDEFEEETIESEDTKQSESKTKVDQKLFSDENIKNEIAELKAFYELAVKIKDNAKGTALITALKTIFKIAKEKNWTQKAVVFTESTRTQEYIRKLLEKEKITYTLFNGSNNSPEAKQIYKEWCKEYPEMAEQGSTSANIRQALISDFEKNKQVLITTEAGAEGLNLQFCNIVINYDLPWNPQRVEQRIGRCHRYGQKYDVLVVNFLNKKNRADQRVLELLEYKLHLFDGLFGTSDEILGLLESGVDFEKKILEIYQTCRTAEDIDKAFDELQNNIQSKIQDEIESIRNHITEYFDEPVRELFEKTKNDLNKSLSEFDRDLLRLCKLYYDGKLIEKDESKHLYGYGEKILAFRELADVEIGKVVRMSKESPIADEAIKSSLNLGTVPIPINNFIYSKSNKKYTLIDPLLNKEGIIYLFKLKVIGVEETDLLAPMTFIKKDNVYEPVSLEVAEELLSLDVEQQNETVNESPLDEQKVLSVWNEWKKQVFEKYQRRNERLYDREIDRIDRYYKDYSLRVDDQIKKAEEEKDELNRKRESSADLSERRELHKKIQDLTLKIDKLQVEQIQLKKEANKLKQKDYEDINKKLELTSEEELIAVTLFKIK